MWVIFIDIILFYRTKNLWARVSICIVSSMTLSPKREFRERSNPISGSTWATNMDPTRLASVNSINKTALILQRDMMYTYRDCDKSAFTFRLS